MEQMEIAEPNRNGGIAENILNCWRNWVIGLVIAVVGLCIVIIVYFTIQGKLITTITICNTNICNKTAKDIINNMRSDINPCNDFYSFVCENSVNTTSLPKNKPYMSPFSRIRDDLDQKLMDMLDELERNQSYTPIKHHYLIKKFYATCNDKAGINDTGLNEIKTVLAELGGWPVLEGKVWTPNYKWYEIMEKQRKLGYSADQIVDFNIVIDVKNSTQYKLRLHQATLGLPDYMLVQGMGSENVNNYYYFMKRIAKKFRAKGDVEIELKNALDFEIQLAKILVPVPRQTNYTATYNLMTFKKLQQEYPIVLNWKTHFESMLGYPVKLDEDETVIVAVPTYFEKLTKLLQGVKDPRIIPNYLMWRIVLQSMQYLPYHLRGPMPQFDTKSLENAFNREQRRECVTDTLNNLRIGVKSMYLRKYFSTSTRANVKDITTEVHAKFKDIVKAVEWMDQGTKTMALEKLKKMTFDVAYSTEFLDDKIISDYYKELDFPQTPNYLRMRRLCQKFVADFYYKLFREPVNKQHWLLYSKVTVANAGYNALRNNIDIPAAILQDIFYNSERPKYMNYAAIGAVIGHEMAHSFSYDGRQLDKDGNLNNWWSDETKKNLKKPLECLVNHYSGYNVSDLKIQINGTLTLEENIADNAGVKAAYLAYKEKLSKARTDYRLHGLTKYSPEQMFWIAFANKWCVNYSLSELEYRAQNSTHPPGKFRVLGVVRNSEYFATDFKCGVDTPMNPKDKCRLY